MIENKYIQQFIEEIEAFFALKFDHIQYIK